MSLKPPCHLASPCLAIVIQRNELEYAIVFDIYFSPFLENFRIPSLEFIAVAFYDWNKGNYLELCTKFPVVFCEKVIFATTALFWPKGAEAGLDQLL